MDVFLARQPIFDRVGEVAGYELLYRRTAQSRFADGDSSNQMSLDVVIQSFLEIGVERITRGKAGFINFGREILLEGSYELLNPQTLVVELLEDVVPDAEVIAACARLVSAGYRLALDDFVVGGPHELLVPYASILKVDVLARPLVEIADRLAPFRRRGVQLLAEKVETSEIHQECKEIGFDLFQGYFYSRPEIVANRGASVEQTAIMQLMNLLGDETATDADVEDGFRRDPSLSYKLLRMINTAAHGGRGIDSIRHAIRMLGRDALHRWLALLLASSFAAGSGTDLELIHTAVLRARLCELLGEKSSRQTNPDALFLVGLFSLMDSLMRISLTELLDRVSLSSPAQAALLQRSGPYAAFLSLAESYEAGDWEAVGDHASEIGLAALEIPEVYLEAAEWSRLATAAAHQ